MPSKFSYCRSLIAAALVIGATNTGCTVATLRGTGGPGDNGVDSLTLTHLTGALFVERKDPVAQAHAIRQALHHDPGSPYLWKALVAVCTKSGTRTNVLAELTTYLSGAPSSPELTYLLGRLQLEAGQYERASMTLETLAKEEGYLLRALPTLVDALLWRGDSALARQWLERVQHLGPDRDTMLRLGGVFEDHGHFEAAEEIYDALAASEPANGRILMALARVAQWRGQDAHGLNVLARRLGFFPKDVRWLLHMADLSTGGPPEETLNLRSRIVAAVRHDIWGKMALAAFDIRHGRAAAGRADLSALVPAVVDGPFASAVYGRILYRHGENEACARIVEPWAEGESTLSHLAGSCLLRAGRYKDAVRYLREAAIRRGEVGPSLRLALAALAPSALRRPEHRALLDPLIRLIPPRAAALWGELIESSFTATAGDGLSALPESMMLADLAGAMMLAGRWQEQGRGGESVNLYRRILADYEHSPGVLNAIGFALVDHGTDLHEAAVYLRRAYRHDSSAPSIMDSMGWLYHKMGRHRRALRWLRRAVSHAPTDDVILRHLNTVKRVVAKRDLAQARF